MNRVDFVDLVVDLVGVDLDVDLIDVNLDIDLVDVDLVDVDIVLPLFLDRLSVRQKILGSTDR
jgi:hypothetical protein